jgi:hypothetical protein
MANTRHNKGTLRKGTLNSTDNRRDTLSSRGTGNSLMECSPR